MKHTPGPWAIGGELISHNDIEIATVMHCYAGKTGKPINRNSPVLGAADANARLIVASPDMFECVSSFVTRFGVAVECGEEINGGDAVDWIGENMAEFKNALKKARGVR